MTEFISKKQRKRVESYLKIDEDITLGGVKIDHDLCKGCKFCVKCCAASALEIVEKKSRMVIDQPFCMACADCVAICPEGAISMAGYIQFNHFFHFLDRGKPEPPRQF